VYCLQLGTQYDADGNSKKQKFHDEARAMAGQKLPDATLDTQGTVWKHGQAVKHWMIAASSGDYDAMHSLLGAFKGGFVSRDIDSTLTAYNNSCAEMRSEARDKYISHEWLRQLGVASKDTTLAAFKFLCQDEE
jgi:hypothetical protein